MLALQSGLLDPLPPDGIETFRTRLPTWLDRSAPKVVDDLARSGQLDAPAIDQLKKALSDMVAHLAPPPAAQTGTT